MDIAGLVRGAASGEGLGNNFLSNIMAVDGIFHVVSAGMEWRRSSVGMGVERRVSVDWPAITARAALSHPC